MFVVNYKSLNKTFTCNKIVANYLTKHKIPLLSIKDAGVFVFSDTDRLQEVIKNAPFWIKALI
ncbi:MAG: hypothetical protein WDA21_04485 [Bacilli bacterium]